MKTWEDFEQFICRAAPNWHPVDYTHKNLQELRNDWKNYDINSHEGVPVYSGGCENTIWSTPEVNMAFRAWHDMVHLEWDYDFSMEGELAVANRQCNTAAHFGYGTFKNVLWLDIVGQRMYYQHTKNYVSNQKEFMLELLKRGCTFGNLEHLTEVITGELI